jgi:hypothetical protein
VAIEFDDASGTPPRYFAGAVAMVTFGASNTFGTPKAQKATRTRTARPASLSMNVKSGAGFTLPRAFVTVLRGKLD